MQTLEPPWRPLADLLAVEVECCKIYLYRPISGFPSLWLPLLIRTYQRMRDCKERLKRNLPIFFSSLVVSKINSMNLFYGNFRIQEKSFASL